MEVLGEEWNCKAENEGMTREFKIVALDAYGVNPGDLDWSPLRRLGRLDVYDATEPSSLVSRASDADAILVNRVRIGRNELERLPKLKYIGAFATGYNFIDVQAAAARGITVTNIPSYSTMSVAQMAFALLLEICQHPFCYDSLTRRGKWSGEPGFDYQPHPLVELDGKQMGIIGLGDIGSAVARMAEAFGMKVAVFTSKAQEDLPEGYVKMGLAELMATSDVVSVHCPLLPETRGLVSAAMIDRMRPSAVFINTARGPIVDESALAEALNSGRIAAAGVDVLSKEPPSADHPLLHARNCFITPHVAWASREARSRALCQAAANLEAFLDGNPVNRVG